MERSLSWTEDRHDRRSTFILDFFPKIYSNSLGRKHLIRKQWSLREKENRLEFETTKLTATWGANSQRRNHRKVSSKIWSQILLGSLAAIQTMHTYAEGHHKKKKKQQKTAGHKEKKDPLSPHLTFIYFTWQPM